MAPLVHHVIRELCYEVGLNREMTRYSDEYFAVVLLRNENCLPKRQMEEKINTPYHRTEITMEKSDAPFFYDVL